MQSNLQDASPMLQQESSILPQPMDLFVKEPVDIVKVNGEANADESIKSSSDNAAVDTRELSETRVNLEDSPSLLKKECSTSLRPTKKNRKRALHRAEGDVENGGDESIGNSSNQLVLYNPDTINTIENTLPVSEHNQRLITSNPSSRVYPSVGAFTVQCANCFKWRLIPTKEKYEEIREHIMERPFTCQQARAWRPDITCDDPADISQDGSRLWAIDKPSIAQPPRGWERQLRIRGEGGTRFADVYYVAPSGKKLRSMVEVQKHLLEHPEYNEQGVKLSQFSFQIPRPLKDNYVRKRPTRVSNPDGGLGLSMPLEPEEVNPLSWVEPTAEDLPVPPANGSPVHCRPCSQSSSPPTPSPSPSKTKKGTKPRIYIKNSSNGNCSGVQQAKEKGSEESPNI
ncbi:uncharacterized protein A4U43_C01F35450 [Asparagus officinalis]|uniref:MBD domain-containing protein n=1 Tax=Asparagus officinalis TaxID=4686 RepID=A0A5P1FVE6_ASPOF|nr:methyl-CpG-binding domain-containing protein 2-like [Asparagus officinalis]ONK82034.1 uncharacterized protein A4U43_C01F35450 [Asparagus officinalis]